MARGKRSTALDGGAPDNPPPVIGGNISELKKKAKEAAEKVMGLEARRLEIGEEITAVRVSLEAEGIPRSAFDQALRDFKKDPDKRSAHDLGYTIVREALGIAQPDLFSSLAPEPEAA